jgi:hypothetical protein
MQHSSLGEQQKLLLKNPDISAESIFAFDPAYDAISIREVQITVDETNLVKLPKPKDGQQLAFKPYPDKHAFRAHYPGVEPREVFYMPFSESPLLKHPPTPGTKVRFRVDLDILSHDQTVCSTNYQADFVLERKEDRVSWALLVLGILLSPLMPRF